MDFVATLDLTHSRRVELGNFLRDRRGRLPKSVATCAPSRRNVRGLRREEVAERADIGVSWYTMLEQGRVENVSLRTLTAVARALQLSALESEHLFALASASFDKLSPNLMPPPDELVSYIERSTSGMNFMVSPQFDVMAFNSIADNFFRFSHHGAAPNLLKIMLTDPSMRAQFVDPNWEEVLHQMTGHLRISYGRVGGAEFQILLEELHRFPDFAAKWDAHLVKPPPAERSVLSLPGQGTFAVNVRAFSSFTCPAYTIIFKTRLDDGPQPRLQPVPPSNESAAPPKAYDQRRRLDLGAFLRQRRERIRPKDIGLAVAGRRHAKGLRREEVAERAGIGVSWYTMLEQGRVENLTQRTLRAVADALMLTHRERIYAERLTLPSFSQSHGSSGVPGADLLRFVRSFPDGHAHFHDAHFDMLSWNSAADEFYGFSSVDRPNLLQLMVRNHSLRHQFVSPSWEETLRRMLAHYRFNHVLSRESQPDAMIAGLVAESSEFAALWLGDRAVQNPAVECGSLLYPRSGPRQVHVLLLTPEDLPTHTLVLKVEG